MKALEEKILKDGSVLPGNILKVGSFLNQQMDVGFLMKMGKEIARLYKKEKITKILTVEASGIAIAVVAAAALKVPAIFAKKSKSSNVSGALYSAVVHSYTHNTDYTITVPADYISSDDRILLVDDFLANGYALMGLKKIVEDAGATVVGAAIAIEKGFQQGGDMLRRSGLRVESLAIIDEMTDTGVSFR